MPSQTAILFQNACQTITLLDITRSLELAQGLRFSQEKQLLSAPPPQTPWTDLPEPKSAKALSTLDPESLENMLMKKHLELALQEVRDMGTKRWNSPRNVRSLHQKMEKIPASSLDEDILNRPASRHEPTLSLNIVVAGQTIQPTLSFPHIHIPLRSTFINGSVESGLKVFTTMAPRFDVVILDPPWPNRSARRKGSYRTRPQIPNILSSIPLNVHLAENALVGVWITNKPSFRALVLEPGCLFDQWGLQLKEEWVWLKVTASGEPLFSLESRWRKPYEILLVGRKGTAWNERASEIGRGDETGVKRRVIIAVPDLHSRKPNLKELFEPMLPAKYEAMELFARNLTEGWWAWGDEVCKFQDEKHWVDRTQQTLD